MAQQPVQAQKSPTQVQQQHTRPANQKTPAEKMKSKPWNWKRQFFQNMTTRYNYYFHANLQLQGILAGVNRERQENYSEFLPFYPYSAESLNLNQSDLDSVITRASIAIQIHDARGKWIDDCYLLIGKAYYYKADWENADKTFAFINMNFAPKKKDEYKTVVGQSKNSQLSIATREKRKGVVGKMKHKSARNDAFLWQAKSYLEQGKYDDAQSLLNILSEDPYYPKRLHGSLAEMQAFRLYKQERYLESIEPLKVAIKDTDDKIQRARMQYILGQIYDYNKQPDSALVAFRDVLSFHPDPLMDFHARLEIAKNNILAEGGSLEESLAALEKMLKKENFIPYRDVIYFTMAEIAMPEDEARAEEFLQRSLKEPSDNTVQKAVTYYTLANMRYDDRNYAAAKKYYDSAAAVMPNDFSAAEIINARKDVLNEVDANIALIHQEDSLQAIAAMDPSSRNIFLEKRASEMKAEAKRKAALFGRENNSFYVPPSAEVTQQRLMNSNPLYAQQNGGQGNVNGSMGDWYFYNPVTKSSGLQEFKRRWGNRPLVDNWRRSAAAGIGTNARMPGDLSALDSVEAQLLSRNMEALPADSITVELLSKNLPLTPELLQQSKQKQMNAGFDLGKLYHDKLENLPEAIKAYDTLLIKFPEHPRKPEILYSLYVWNDQASNTQAAERYKNQLLKDYGATEFARAIRGVKFENVDDQNNKAALALYDSAYINYLSGNYDIVLQNKKAADSLYQKYPHQAQFEILNSMALAKLGDEAGAKAALEAVIQKYTADDEIIAKAQSLLNVMNHKQELVDYLSGLQVQNTDDRTRKVDENINIVYPWQRPDPKLVDSTQLQKAKDSLQNITPEPPPKPKTPYKLKGDDLTAANPHFVVLSFNRVEKAMIDKGVAQFSKYNAEKHAGEGIEVSSFVLTPTDIMLIFRLFPNEEAALKYWGEVQKEAPKSIIPHINPKDYSIFIISRENFILLNTSKDLQGYKEFFESNYELN